MIVVLGGINMDLVTLAPRFPQAGETVIGTRFLTYPGGKGANQAVACARLGAKTSMVGRVGGDVFGSQLLEALKAARVDVSRVRPDQDNTSVIAVINMDATAQNRIIQVLGANSACDDTEARSAVEALHDASVLLLQLEVPVEVSLSAARQAAVLGRCVILDPAPARDIPDEFYRYCDYITPNETEAAALVGFPVTDIPSAEKAAGELLQRGAKCVIIKMGEQGACYATVGDSGHVPAFRMKAVDTVAAGDAFNAGLAVALAESKGLSNALGWASAAGALSVTRVGAQDSMPYRHQVETMLSEGS